MRELHARVGTMLRLRTVRDSAARGITIRGGNRTYSLTFGDIVYISSHSKSIVVHTGEGDIEVPVLLKEIVHRLPPDIFVRIHKSHIINIRYVHSVSHVLSGRYRVRLKDEDDTELPVGPFFLEDLRKKMIAAGNG
jgi:DNA-binding LytR/AlgR family response regulator